MGTSTTSPDKPISGGSVIRDSLSGRKSKFVSDSTIGTTSVTVAAGDIWSIIFQLSLYNPDIPREARTIDNIVDDAGCVAWPLADFYVDTNNDENYLLGVGGLLSLDQQKVTVHTMYRKDPDTISGSTTYSATTVYQLYNHGASSHVVYFHGYYKFIIYGEDTF